MRVSAQVSRGWLYSSLPRLPDRSQNPQTCPHFRPSSHCSTRAGVRWRPRGWTLPGRERSPVPGLGRRERGRGLPEARGPRPLPVARPAGARPPLPVVAVISERREVLLQLAVRLLEPLAQVLELAAERGLEGRVLGVHARAAPAVPAPSPASPPPAAPPFVLLPSSLSLPCSRDRGLPAHWAGPRRRRSRWRGKWGGGAGGGGAGRHEGSRPLRGCRWDPLPSRGGLRRGGCRAHRPPPREKEPVGRSNTRSSAAQDKNMKGHPLCCSCWERGETGGDRKKGKWGLETDRTGQRLEPAPFSTMDSPRLLSPPPQPPPWVLLGLMQKHLKPSPFWLCHNKYFLTINECVQMRCLFPHVL